MQFNLVPSKELYLAARKDLAYLLILLATGLICLLPVGYTIGKLVHYTALTINATIGWYILQSYFV